MKRKVITIAGILFGVVILGLFFAVDYFYGEAVERGQEVELYSGDKAVEVFASPQDQSMLKEAREWFDEQEHEVVEQTSYDDLTLRSIFLENDSSPGKAVILAHGYRSTAERMKDYAKFYYDQGFDILIPDARGHGESEGDYIGYGWHDRLDYLGWIEKLIDDFDTENIILHGNSMGAATVLMASGEELPSEVKGIIADSGYTTVKEELTHQLKHLYNLPAFPLLDFTSWMTKVRSGYTFEEASAINQVKDNTVPLLIVHGEEDELVPTEMAHQLFDVAGGDKELWVVPEAGHTDAYEVATLEYQKRLLEFLDQAIK